MSAYTGGPPTTATPNIRTFLGEEPPEESLLPAVPELPKIDRALEAYFQIARQLESVLNQYRNQSRKGHEDLKLLESKYTQTKFDLESRLLEAQQRDEQLKALVKTLEQNLKRSQNRTQEVATQNTQLNETKKHLQHQLEVLNTQYMAAQQRESSLKALVENLQNADRMHSASVLQLQSQLGEYDRREKQHQDQIKALTQEVENIRRQERKAEVDEGVWSAKVDYHREREKTILEELDKVRRTSNHLTADFKRIAEQYETTRTELGRYKSMWPNVTTLQGQAARATQLNRELEARLREVQEALQKAQSQLVASEENRNKEKRDKQIALNCLHTAEQKIEELSAEVDGIRQRTAEINSDAIPTLKLL